MKDKNSPSHLVLSNSSFPGSNKRGVRQQGHRVEGPRGKVRSNWAEDDEEQRSSRPRHAKRRLDEGRGSGEEQEIRATSGSAEAGQLQNTHLGSYEGGSDVEAGALRVRDPFLVNLHQLLYALQQLPFIKQLKDAPETDLFVTKNINISINDIYNGPSKYKISM